MGVKTVVKLRAFSSDRKIIGDTGIAYERIYMKPWHIEDEDVIRFLQIATDPARTPVFVHCKRGADRTGLVCAVYRMVVCKWPREKAVRETTEGGFGFAKKWKNIVKYLEHLNVEEIKRRAGIADENNQRSGPQKL